MEERELLSHEAPRCQISEIAVPFLSTSYFPQPGTLLKITGALDVKLMERVIGVNGMDLNLSVKIACTLVEPKKLIFGSTVIKE